MNDHRWTKAGANRTRREMAQTRGVLNRKDLPVVKDERPRMAPRPLPERVEHPVVEPTHENWFRVYRLTKGPNGTGRECIGEFRTAAAAIVHAENELYRAHVRDWENMPVHDTWRAHKVIP